MRATNAPSWLGAAAASLGAAEVAKLREGAFEHAAVGRELLLDLRHHVLQSSRLLRSPRCRFDHESWKLEVAQLRSLRDAFALGGEPRESVELGVWGDAFVSALYCGACALRAPVWRPERALDAAQLACPHCGELRRVTGFDLARRLPRRALPEARLDLPLRELGLRAGDVFEVGPPGARARFLLSPEPRSDVVLAGCGNIGSFLAPLLARLPGLERLTLVDPDRFEPAQVRSQNARPEDVGRPKAQALAERVRALVPELDARFAVAPLKTLPLGSFRGAVVVSALDSRRARLELAERAWRVGSPFVDTAVDGAGQLVRVNVYLPGRDQPCFECGFHPDDYAGLEQVLPCHAAAHEEN